MKEYLIFGIFLYLTKHRKTTAKEIAQEFEISSRSVYRYIDALSLAGMPLITKLGRGGGIELMGEFKLEGFVLSKKEKEQLKDFIAKISNERIIGIIRKIIL